MAGASSPKNPVQLAVVGAPHGTGGEMRVKSFTRDPMSLGDYGALFAEDGRAFTVAGIRPSRDVVIVRFREVQSRTDAEALTGTPLYVDRSRLPDDLDEEEYYHADLIGLRVVDPTGDEIGTVAALHDFGAGDILELSLVSGQRVMTPFTKAAFPKIDIAAGVVLVDAIAAGLEDPGVENDENRQIPGNASRTGSGGKGGGGEA